MMLLDKYSQKYFCPLFDNGTSLGYEILEEKFDSFNINAYIKRGRHHMKFKLTDDNKDKFLGEQHLEMIKQLYYTYPKIVSSKLKKIFNFKCESFKKELLVMSKIETYEGFELTNDRIDFIVKLLYARINFLREWYYNEISSK